MVDDSEDAATAAALKRFVRDGSELSRAMEIDLFVAVPDEKSGLSVAERATALGFRTKVDFNASERLWSCYCTKEMIPKFKAVREVEKALDVIGRQYGGHADGFGSFGNAIGPN